MSPQTTDRLPSEPARVRLAHLPTPIEPLQKLAAVSSGLRIDIKRDDLTGVVLSGNKIRKLEFVLADALAQRATCVITCGGVQSNHARATAAAAVRVGLRSHLLLSGAEPPDPDGNLFLGRLLGADVRFITAEQYEQRDRLMGEVAAEVRAAGARPYLIPEGASNAIGAWGYVAMLRELLAQRPEFPWGSIVCATGSGGTHAGLLIGSRLLGLDVHIRSYLVHRTRDYFVRQVLEITEDFERRFGCRTGLRAEDVDVVAGYQGSTYAQIYPEEVEVIHAMAREEGIVLDPVYTGKAFTGLLSEIHQGEYGSRDRILFIHTGGIYGLLAQRDRFL